MSKLDFATEIPEGALCWCENPATQRIPYSGYACDEHFRMQQGLLHGGLDFMEKWLKEHKQNAKHEYFLTFTTKQDVDKKKWLKRLKFELSRKYVVDFKLCFEHKDTNVHAHVKVKSTKHLKKQMFKTYETAFGWIDIRLIKHDNGIDEYMEKEATDFILSVEEFDNYEI